MKAVAAAASAIDKSGVKLTGREGQRFGVVEDVGQLGLAAIDRRRRSERGQPTQEGQDDPHRQDPPRRSGEEPPAGVSGLNRRPSRLRLDRRVCQLNGHL